MTITPFDDYPIHQTPLPVAHPASGDRNHYDRYFFNGYDADAGWYLGVALGVYPNRHVVDAAFSIASDGVQRSVFASGRASLDRGVTHVGPIAIEVTEPLGRNRVRVDADHLGISAELVWHPRTAAVEEPRQTLLDGPHVVLDATRFVQWGTWDGSVTTGDDRIEVSGAFGTKDRSWGVRPVGEPAGGAPSGALGVFFLWAPVHFSDRCAHAVLFDDPDGHRTYETAFRVPLLGQGDPPWGVEVEDAHRVSYRLAYAPGTRRAREASFTFDDEWTLLFEPILRFQMKGLGYLHPRWRHGVWHGEEAEGADEWRLDDLDPLELENVHTQQLCRVTDGKHEGVGVLEQLAIGPHAPTGLRDLLDPGA